MWIGFHGWFLITTACIRIFNRTKPASRIPYIYNNNIYILNIYIYTYIYICKYSISQKDRKVAPHYFSFGFHFFSILLRLPFHLEIPGGCGSKQQTAHDHRPSSPPSRNAPGGLNRFLTVGAGHGGELLNCWWDVSPCRHFCWGFYQQHLKR